PFADIRKGFQVLSHQIDVNFRPECFQTGLVDMNAGLDVVLLQTKKNHPGVDEFFALHSGNDPNDSVIKRVLFGHGWPPGRSLTNRSVAGPASQHTPCAWKLAARRREPDRESR